MNKLRIAVQKARGAGYNEENKADFKRFSLGLLRSIAKELQLVKGSYSIRFNAGGIAVSGDATLHHDAFYLTIGETGVMFRTCKGQKDYTGGPNNWAIGFGLEMDQRQLVMHLQLFIDKRVKQIQSESFAGFPHGVQGGAGSRPWDPGTRFDHLPDAYPAK